MWFRTADQPVPKTSYDVAIHLGMTSRGSVVKRHGSAYGKDGRRIRYAEDFARLSAMAASLSSRCDSLSLPSSMKSLIVKSAKRESLAYIKQSPKGKKARAQWQRWCQVRGDAYKMDRLKRMHNQTYLEKCEKAFTEVIQKAIAKAPTPEAKALLVQLHMVLKQELWHEFNKSNRSDYGVAGLDRFSSPWGRLLDITDPDYFSRQKVTFRKRDKSAVHLSGDYILNNPERFPFYICLLATIAVTLSSLMETSNNVPGIVSSWLAGVLFSNQSVKMENAGFLRAAVFAVGCATLNYAIRPFFSHANILANVFIAPLPFMGIAAGFGIAATGFTLAATLLARVALQPKANAILKRQGVLSVKQEGYKGLGIAHRGVLHNICRYLSCTQSIVNSLKIKDGVMVDTGIASIREFVGRSTELARAKGSRWMSTPGDKQQKYESMDDKEGTNKVTQHSSSECPQWLNVQRAKIEEGGLLVHYAPDSTWTQRYMNEFFNGFLFETVFCLDSMGGRGIGCLMRSHMGWVSRHVFKPLLGTTGCYTVGMATSLTGWTAALAYGGLFIKPHLPSNMNDFSRCFVGFAFYGMAGAGLRAALELAATTVIIPAWKISEPGRHATAKCAASTFGKVSRVVKDVNDQLKLRSTLGTSETMGSGQLRASYFERSSAMAA